VTIVIPSPDDTAGESLFLRSRPAPRPGIFELGVALDGTAATGADNTADDRSLRVLVLSIATASVGAINVGFLGSCHTRRSRTLAPRMRI
jgi:hypothetical protein